MISYVIVDGDIQDFKFLKNKKAEIEDINEGKRLKIDIYISDKFNQHLKLWRIQL